MRTIMPFLITALLPLSARAQMAPAVTKDTGIDHGLAVHIGATDGKLETDLAAPGRFLVHALALTPEGTDTARAAIQAAGVYPLASVETWPGRADLPYASEQVDLLIADEAALKSLKPEEVLRVVRPGGVAYLGAKGTWKKTVKPRDPNRAEWRHFDGETWGGYGSADKVVRPPNQLQWVAGDYRTEWWPKQNPAGFYPGMGIRVAGGRVIYWAQDFTRETEKANRYKGLLVARGAYNGVREWTLKADDEARFPNFMLAADSQRIVTIWPGGKQEGKPLVAVDAATGKRLSNFEAMGITQGDRNNYQVASYNLIRLAGEQVLQVSDKSLLAMDAATGKVRWKFDNPTGAMMGASVDQKAKRVYVVLHDGSPISPWLRDESGKNKKDYDMNGRWPRVKCRAIAAIDLATGKPIWECKEVNGLFMGQILPVGENVVGFGTYPMGSVALIRASDGKMLWQNTPSTKSPGDNPYNAVVRDDGIYIHYFKGGSTRMVRVDYKDGAVTQVAPIYLNSRCMPLTQTPDWLVFGLGIWVDRQGEGQLVGLARAGCATPVIAAEGMSFYDPNACHCMNQIRGDYALTYEAPKAEVPDADRLDRTPRKAGGAVSTKLPDSPLVAEWTDGDWTRTRPTVPNETEPADAGDGIKIVAVTHQHRIEARKEGKVLWSFTTDGRVSSTPLVHDGSVYAGGDDAYLYCLDARTGVQKWRFFAAPWHRKTFMNGQLISSWPISNVLLHEGRITFAAGLHAALAGGVRVWALDPATGAVAWKKTVEKSPAKFPSVAGVQGKAKWPAVTTEDTHPPVNAGLWVTGGKLMLGAGRTDDQRGQATISP